MMACGDQDRCHDEQVCDNCGSHDVVPIVQGTPTPEAMELAHQGKVFLDGCFLSHVRSLWICRDCEHRMGSNAIPDQVELYQGQLRSLCSSVPPMTPHDHRLIGGRNDMRKMLRLFAGAGANSIECRGSPGGNSLRLHIGSEWVEMSPPEESYVRDIMHFLEHEEATQRTGARGMVEVTARVGRRECRFLVQLERNGDDLTVRFSEKEEENGTRSIN